MQQVALKIKDALDPAGGVADLVVSAECPQSSDQEIEVRRPGDQLVHLGPGGWQDGSHRFLAVFAESDGGSTVYKIGPDVVNQMAYGTAAQISFPALELVGRISWPDVPPSLTSDASVGKSVKSDLANNPTSDLSNKTEPTEHNTDQSTLTTDNSGTVITTAPDTKISTQSEDSFVNQKERENVEPIDGDIPNRTDNAAPRFYKFYQVGFFFTFPLLLLCAAFVVTSMTKTPLENIDQKPIDINTSVVNSAKRSNAV